jgi:hypothetical protein
VSVLGVIRRVLSLAVAIWAFALIVFYLFFATISYESTSAAGVPGQPPIITNSTGQIPWISQAGPVAVAFMLAFSLMLVITAVAIWRGALAVALPLSLVALILTFITGFSIGGLYFPGAVVAFLESLLLGTEKLWVGRGSPTPPLV